MNKSPVLSAQDFLFALNTVDANYTDVNPNCWLVSRNRSFSMISPEFKEIVKACAEQFKVKTVWLFGSAVEDENKATDIDIAVEGLAPEKFFEFYGRLFFELPKPVDLVDLSREPPIAAIVREKGVRIYERGK